MLYLIGVLMVLAGAVVWAEKGCIKGSTIEIFKETRPKRLFTRNFLYFYLYARWPRYYIKAARRLMPTVKEKKRKAVADTYHSKILTPELAKKIININEKIPLQDLEQIIPYPAARKIVLTNPVEIAALECPCRASAKNGCTPSMVCLVIGKPFTDFILEHHPGKSKKLTQEEALELLETVHQKGCLHTAYFKEACLDRFYAICNCCKCCCAGLEAMVKYGIPMLAPSGYSARIDAKVCLACGVCREKCPFDAITESYQVIREKCMGCGICVSSCKKNAVILERDQTKGVPLDVQALARDC